MQFINWIAMAWNTIYILPFSLTDFHNSRAILPWPIKSEDTYTQSIFALYIYINTYRQRKNSSIVEIDIKKMAAPQAVFEAILNYGAASASRNASLCATSADRAEATVCTTTEMTIATLKKKHGQYQYRPLSI